MNFGVSSLLSAYKSGEITPAEVIRETYRCIRERGERPVWITVVPEEKSLARAESLGRFREDLPLYGIPFAIKDNIDLADVPTTAGCPEFTYTPARSANVVERLIQAGAVPVGKTNLDQFATGLVGVRSPYGACSSVFNDRYISGGSSSGSAVSVASGLVSFALGTDTAGSGRVPAAFNGIVGMKPTRGAVSTAGVVPACRTLDCISIFALNCADCDAVFRVVRGFDADDHWSRRPAQLRSWPRSGFRFGVPSARMLRFFGDDSAAGLFEDAIRRLRDLGGEPVEIDYSAFEETAKLLYSGPWVAERLEAIRNFADSHPGALHPITAKIILGARDLAAADAFAGMYRLESLKRAAEREWQRMDYLLVPTAGACYTHEQIAEEPIALNTNLGYYTNFVNLLDLAAVAVPAGVRSNGLPFGVSLIGPAWSDFALLGTADQLHGAYTGFGAMPQPYCPEGYVPLAVCGAHLTGQPLNYQLRDARAFLIESTFTSPEYRLFALSGTNPAKPGLLLEPERGSSIEVEVWAIPQSSFGGFVAAVPPPLAIGSCTLASGRRVKSFVCEPIGFSNATDITHLGGWRAYVRSSTSIDKVLV
ncbi:MAG TPA: allophanate hydrolase [Bryobacteraceae bacterium]|nr:allophanate hydrolase [Bryobacteraceae bacterium]